MQSSRSQRPLDTAPALPPAEPQTGTATEWRSEQLFGPDRATHEIGIRHEGHLYRLRRTKLGKLILTK